MSVLEIPRSCPRCQQPIIGTDGICAPCVLSNALELSSDSNAEELGVIRYLGDYELLGEIARGGMGIVYRARQTALNRNVAVKVISNGAFASPEIIRRFRAEAEVAARLDHPHIVPIFEVGEHDGLPYFSMGLIEGETLGDTVARGPMNARDAARLVTTIASAVHFAHERGVLHRDLKPNNILLDQHGSPHLTDFGLAKLLDDESGLTRTHVVMGTPGFMSPEQAVGGSSSLTTAADVYSLGAILFHCLTSKLPFEGANCAAVLHQVINTPAKKPSLHVRAIDSDLDAICLKCLEKKPSDRYSSAHALAQDLERWLAGKPILARNPGPVEVAIKLARRHPIPAALLLLLAVTSVTGAILILNQWRRAEKALVFAQQQTLATEQQRNIAEARLYAGDMSLVGTALFLNNYRRAQTLLDAYVPKPGQVDRRGIEWRYQWMRSYSDELAHFQGPFGNVRGMDFSPDGKHLVTVEDGHRRVRAWDLSERRMIKSIRMEKGFYVDAIFSPDGKTIALAGPGPELRAFPSLELLWATNYSRHFHNPRFSPDGKHLVIARDGGSEVFEARSGRLVANLPYAGEGLAFSKDGALLYSASPIAFSEWDTATWTLRRSATNNTYIASIALSPDEQLLAVAGHMANIRLLRVSDFSDAATFPKSGTDSVDIAFSPDGSNIFSAHIGNVAIKWDAKTGVEVERMRGHKAALWGLALSKDGKTLATGGLDEIFLHRAEAINRPFFERKVLGSLASDPATTPDQAAFAVLSTEGIEVRSLTDPTRLIWRLPQNWQPARVLSQSR